MSHMKLKQVFLIMKLVWDGRDMAQWLYHCHLTNFLKVLSIHQLLVHFSLIKIIHDAKKDTDTLNKKSAVRAAFFNQKVLALCYPNLLYYMLYSITESFSMFL